MALQPPLPQPPHKPLARKRCCPVHCCPQPGTVCACRLKEEHTAKLEPLQELNESLLEELSAKRHDANHLAALQEELAHAVHRLEMEASGRQELWQRVCALEQERDATQDKLAAATKHLKRAEQQLGESHAAPVACLVQRSQ